MYQTQSIDLEEEKAIQETGRIKADLLSSLSNFTRTFYKLRTGRDFDISIPNGRVSHNKIIFDAFTDVFHGKIKKLIINLPPGYSKTEHCINFIAWTQAHYPDSNTIYTSVTKDLASIQTGKVRDIINHHYYKKLFNISIRQDHRGRDDFSLIQGGTVVAIGADGTIVGRDAGILGCKRWGGSLISDDLLKPQEANSDTIREKIPVWLQETLFPRRRDVSTPTIMIGQRLHQYDYFTYLIEKEGVVEEGGEWTVIRLPALDENNNPLNPARHNLESLLRMKDFTPYFFASQMQQDPQPAGGGIFKIDRFPILTEEPKILMTFITADTAETSKEYNDATAFSLWGIYKVEQFGITTDIYALHWINCWEIFVEPKNLKDEFMEFYACSSRNGIIPRFAVIEKKSTGVTLTSVLNEIQGLQIIGIDRNASSGSKADRHISMERYVNQKLFSLPYGAKHTKMCIDHMSKITANNSQRRSDIADTAYDACKFVFIDKIAIGMISKNNNDRENEINMALSRMERNDVINNAKRWK